MMNVYAWKKFRISGRFIILNEVLRQQNYPNLSKVEVQKGEEFLYDL